MLLRAPSKPYRYHRYSRPSRLRFIPLLLFLLALYDLCSTLLPAPIHRAPLHASQDDASASAISNPASKPNTERIFIASIKWNSEPLLRSSWSSSILSLVHHLGPSNVYISILEGGSWDNTRAALTALDIELGRLGVERSIVFDDRTHQQEVERVPANGEEGWVWTSRGKKELRRIPYMAGLRNRILGVLRGLEAEGKVFDKILWINDVVFTTEDVSTLLQTRNGSYAAACSLDFSSPPLYHDTAALLDINGNTPISRTWPYFSSYISRHALYSNSPIPVQSCWNGLISFSTQPFYDNPSLNFRGIPDSLAAEKLEASECCLIHIDNKFSREMKGGVWVNPNVRVGYDKESYEAVNPGGGGAVWPELGGWERVQRVWGNRWVGVGGWVDRRVERWRIGEKVREWEARAGAANGGMAVGEVGTSCLVDGMQVLTENGWASV